MNERNRNLRTVSRRLFWVLGALAALGVVGAMIAHANSNYIPTPLVILFVGFIGGFVGLQRRMKILPPDDLALLADSWFCIALSPIAGAILAEFVYLLFLSGLLTGTLFPQFVNDADFDKVDGFRKIFSVHCSTPADYAKIVIWSFVAGFSEKFVSNLISQFDSSGSGQSKPQEQTSGDREADAREGDHTSGS